uniref:Uncharacterized protein n=1 Tax=Arundo donax TaxID=35708 RepID=A0A0A9AXK2_ARUDO
MAMAHGRSRSRSAYSTTTPLFLPRAPPPTAQGSFFFDDAAGSISSRASWPESCFLD